MIKFTVTTVTYNAEEVVERTIRTVITQSYDNLEYIIVDGGSTDGTLDIIKKYAAGDDRIRYISEPIYYMIPRVFNTIWNFLMPVICTGMTRSCLMWRGSWGAALMPLR